MGVDRKERGGRRQEERKEGEVRRGVYTISRDFQNSEWTRERE